MASAMMEISMWIAMTSIAAGPLACGGTGVQENTEEACSDGVSNDGDDYVDCDDFDCDGTAVCGG